MRTDSNARAAGDTQPSRPSVRLTKKQSTNLVNFTHRLTAALHFLAKSVRAHSASESNAALATNCEALARGLRALPANAVDFGLLFQGITAAEAALKALGGDRGFVQKTKWRLFHRQVVRADVASLASSSLRQLHADATILRSFLKKSGVPADRFDMSDLNPANALKLWRNRRSTAPSVRCVRVVSAAQFVRLSQVALTQW